jgi:uncharacterized protein YlxW (UPF0749 family)
VREERAPVTSAPTTAERRAAIEAMIAEMRRMNAQSEQTWADIERLKAESAALQAENSVIKARIDRRLEALAGVL